jgi:methylenetetrahydrofolate reductase (NADPH)
VRITDYIAKNPKTFFSFEILPPLKGHNVDDLFDNIRPLMYFEPKFINVTYHREEYKTKTLPDGTVQRYSTRKRPGTVAMCAAIKHRFGVEPVPHLICGGFDREETENALIDCHYLGIQNVLALRGDPMKGETHFNPTIGGNANALALIKQIRKLNNGHFLHEEMEGAIKTDFCIGASGYPEKHFEAATMDADLAYLKEKVDAGADFIVTQLFYDNQAYFKFVEACRSIGINVPIIPGLKPITTLKQIELLPRIFFINYPPAMLELLHKCKTDADVKQVGIE